MHIIGVNMKGEYLDCMWLADESGTLANHRLFHNSPTGLRQLQEWLHNDIDENSDNICLVVNVTDIYRSVFHTLSDFGVKISAINPMSARDYANSCSICYRTSQNISLILAKYGRKHFTKLRFWKFDSTEVKELKAMVAELSVLSKKIRKKHKYLNKLTAASNSSEVIASVQKIIDSLNESYTSLAKKIELFYAENYQVPAIGCHKICQQCLTKKRSSKLLSA